MTKDKMTVYLAKDIKKKAKVMAAQMGISVSHLIEGLLAGIQIPKEKN